MTSALHAEGLRFEPGRSHAHHFLLPKWSHFPDKPDTCHHDKTVCSCLSSCNHDARRLCGCLVKAVVGTPIRQSSHSHQLFMSQAGWPAQQPAAGDVRRAGDQTCVLFPLAQPAERVVCRCDQSGLPTYCTRPLLIAVGKSRQALSGMPYSYSEQNAVVTVCGRHS